MNSSNQVAVLREEIPRRRSKFDANVMATAAGERGESLGQASKQEQSKAPSEKIRMTDRNSEKIFREVRSDGLMV